MGRRRNKNRTREITVTWCQTQRVEVSWCQIQRGRCRGIEYTQPAARLCLIPSDRPQRSDESQPSHRDRFAPLLRQHSVEECSHRVSEFGLSRPAVRDGRVELADPTLELIEQLVGSGSKSLALSQECERRNLRCALVRSTRPASRGSARDLTGLVPGRCGVVSKDLGEGYRCELRVNSLLEPYRVVAECPTLDRSSSAASSPMIARSPSTDGLRRRNMASPLLPGGRSVRGLILMSQSPSCRALLLN